MSIAIATMGKFIPGAGATRVVERIIDTGSSGYGVHYTKKKPQVIINKVAVTKERKPNIKITSIEEM